jgi:hypothetical protein
MSADSFTVDLDELRQVKDGLRRLREELDKHPVHDLDADAGSFGHPELAKAVTDYCHRWQVGIQNLSDDARGTEDRLSATIEGYERVDAANADSITKLLGDSDA